MDTEEREAAGVTEDPGWVLHETQVAGEPADCWLYHYADGAVVDEDGTPYEPHLGGVFAPVDDIEEPAWGEAAFDEPEVVPDEPTEPGSTAEPAHDEEPASDLARLPARTVVLVALVVSVLLTFGLLGVVVSRWGGPTPPVETATPASQLELPVAVARDSEYVRSRIAPNGDIRVDHWVAATRPIPRIVLGPPVAPGARRITARDVRVETPDGQRPGPDVIDGSREVYALDGAEEVHVSYVLSGAVSRSAQGSTRALARVTSLDLSYPGGRVPRTVLLQGGRLLSAACTSDAAAQPRPCGQAEGRSWRVRLEPPERDDLVLAQLDLG